MSNYLVDSSDLTSIANAIRTTGGTSASLAFPAGFISAIQALGGGGSSGITEYETGTYTTSSNVARPTISFSNTHSVPPSIIILVDTTGSNVSNTSTNISFTYIDWYRIFGAGSVPNGSAANACAMAAYHASGSSTTSISSGTMRCTVNSDSTATPATTTYSKYFATNTGFMPYSNSNSRYWRSGRTYKWIAIWYTM